MRHRLHILNSRQKWFLLLVALLAVWVTLSAVCAAFWSSGRVPEDARQVLRTVMPGEACQQLSAPAAALVVEAFSMGGETP